MNKRLRFIAFVVVIVVSFLPLLAGKLAFLRGDLFEVVKVNDGDTIEVLMSGNIETIRFIGIDTPETHHPNVGEQCFGLEATEYLKEIITDKVQLISDPKSTNRDRYNRLLRYVYGSDGSFLNLQQVRKGYGFATTTFRHSLMEVFISAEILASQQGLGLWSACKVDLDGIYPQTQELY